jgi:hypothetical protein
MKGEETFQVRYLNTKHYKNNIITSTWIANKLLDKFRIQPNFLIKALYENVKDNWNIDVTTSKLYRTRRKAYSKIFEKLDKQ